MALDGARNTLPGRWPKALCQRMTQALAAALMEEDLAAATAKRLKRDGISPALAWPAPAQTAEGARGARSQNEEALMDEDDAAGAAKRRNLHQHLQQNQHQQHKLQTKKISCDDWKKSEKLHGWRR